MTKEAQKLFERTQYKARKLEKKEDVWKTLGIRKLMWEKKLRSLTEMWKGITKMLTLEKILRLRHEAGQEKPVRCKYAQIEIFPVLYNCLYDGSCKTKILFGNHQYCREELKRYDKIMTWWSVQTGRLQWELEVYSAV